MGDKKKPDFSGYVTKYGIECSDGRTILSGAFEHMDGEKVPLVWMHNHDDPENVLGHVLLEKREDGVYGYGFFNETIKGTASKQIVEHGDVVGLSIFANKLKETLGKVKHGIVREVSLVLAQANPGAYIEPLELAHGDDIITIEDAASIYHDALSEDFLYGDDVIDPLAHAERADTPPAQKTEDDEPTAQDVFDSMSDEQKDLLHYMVGKAAKGAEGPDGKSTPKPKDGEDTVEHSGANADPDKKEPKKHMRNIFDRTEDRSSGIPIKMLAHDGMSERHVLKKEDLQGIAHSAIKMGSMRAAVEAYASEHLEHGIESIDILFPDARALTTQPEFDKRRTEWVQGVLNGTRKTPFSRVKTLFADITADEARAKGYIKGAMKKEEFFKLVKRTTGPATVYKKQKLDRDDILDITDFDIVAWLKLEIRLMLDEEIARAILIGDGRAFDDEDKIADPAGANSGDGIRSILHDDDLYALKVNVQMDGDSTPQDGLDAILMHMSKYKGTGTPTLYTTLPTLTKWLLIRDAVGRRLYKTKSDIAAELMVDDIVTVEVMETEPNLVGIIVNLTDYTLGADRGGDIAFFDDFDIDFNQYKYLMETRLSGGLSKIRSALVILKVGGEDVLVEPVTKPTFNATTGVITIPTQTGVTYKRADTNATVASGAMAALAAGTSLKIYAKSNAGFYFDDSEGNDWTFARPAA